MAVGEVRPSQILITKNLTSAKAQLSRICLSAELDDAALKRINKISGITRAENHRPSGIREKVAILLNDEQLDRRWQRAGC